jgi:hypothetical protein
MSTALLTERLDALESSLPAIPARILRLQRTIAGTTYDRYAAFFGALADSITSFLETARVSGKTVTGQARAAAGDVATTVSTGAKTVGGQAVAQGRKVSKSATRETTKVVDTAIDQFDDEPGSGTPYEQWTKAQLVERAKELSITGPTRLSKSELIATLRAA